MPLSGHFMGIEDRGLMSGRRNTNSQMKSASEARLSQLPPFGNTEPTCFYATIWTRYGHWGSGPCAPDGEIPPQSNVKCLMVTKGGS